MSAEHSLTSITTLEMDFRCDPSIVSRTRQHLEGLYAELTEDEDLAYKVSMVIYELLENVSKYASSSTRSTLEVTLREDPSDRAVRIRTRNAAAPNRLLCLCQVLDEIAVQTDTQRFYDKVLERRASADDGESGLGLARICAEGDMRISYSLDGNQVTVEAEWRGRRVS